MLWVLPGHFKEQFIPRLHFDYAVTAEFFDKGSSNFEGYDVLNNDRRCEIAQTSLRS